MTPAQFRLTVRVNPNTSRRKAVWRGDFLKVNLTAPPEGGRANREPRTYLSDLFGIDAARVRIVRGKTAREKELVLENLDRDILVRHLRSLKAPD